MENFSILNGWSNPPINLAASFVSPYNHIWVFSFVLFMFLPLILSLVCPSDAITWRILGPNVPPTLQAHHYNPHHRHLGQAAATTTSRGHTLGHSRVRALFERLVMVRARAVIGRLISPLIRKPKLGE